MIGNNPLRTTSMTLRSLRSRGNLQVGGTIESIGVVTRGRRNNLTGNPRVATVVNTNRRSIRRNNRRRRNTTSAIGVTNRQTRRNIRRHVTMRRMANRTESSIDINNNDSVNVMDTLNMNLRSVPERNANPIIETPQTRRVRFQLPFHRMRTQYARTRLRERSSFGSSMQEAADGDMATSQQPNRHRRVLRLLPLNGRPRPEVQLPRRREVQMFLPFVEWNELTPRIILVNSHGVSEDRLSLIPTAETTLDDINETCRICLDKYRLTEMLSILGCRHRFHKSCLDFWIRTHNSCPLCRTPVIVEEGYHFHI